MVGKRAVTIVVITVLLLTLTSLPVAAQATAEESLYHTVVWGETLSSIAYRYNVTVAALVEANGLTNPNLIYTGQRLLIPTTETYVEHIVVAGETLLGIAAKYGVSVNAIIRRNGILNMNLIFVGQKLIIPGGDQVEPTPEPGAPSVQEAIIITSPVLSDEVSSPVTITGWGSGFENSLAVDILDEAGNVIGQGYVTVDAEVGLYGPFTGTVEFTPPATAQEGRISVYSISPRDGAIEHLASVTVNLQP